jgi:predicted dehydrogenase
MKKHRVAIVGCGALAEATHLPHCQQNPRVELVAACDRMSDAAERCRDRFGAQRAETDWRRIVGARDIDVCILCTHTNLRAEFIVPALESGKAVYTEKPLASSRSEMIDILRAARRTGRAVCVGHNRRSSPAVLEFKRLLDMAKADGCATRPSVDRAGTRRASIPEERQLQLLFRINDDVRSWKDWVFWDEQGILFGEMVHFIDLALWFNDAHPVRVFAEGSPRGNFVLVMRFSDGSITTMHHTLVGNFDYPKELFEATARNVTVAMDQHIEVRQCGLRAEPAQRYFPYAPESEWAGRPGMAGYMRECEAEQTRAAQAGEAARRINVVKGHAAHLDRFLTHVEGDGENPCGVESAVVVSRIALKFLESSRLGLPVAINPEDWHLPSD